jgi:hypoxanthine phosphoribosyltransferase
MDGVAVLIGEQEIRRRIDELAGEIAASQPPQFLIVGILVGSFVFTADLIRALDRLGRAPQVEFIRLSSYRDAKEPLGAPRLIGPPPDNLAGRKILLVDDVVDTGHSMERAKSMILDEGAERVNSCALLDKPSRRQVDVTLDHVGFTIEDVFVVGYGIDYAREFRHLPYIGKVG